MPMYAVMALTHTIASVDIPQRSKKGRLARTLIIESMK
jgi:hypothetical protein